MIDQSATQPRRATALDALRGLAILAMVLVAVQPYHVLPGWMYHAQEQPPTHEVVSNAWGLTWPDLVFPFFLFTLGAAIPLALGRRMDSGEPKHRILRSVLSRGALLLFFALFRQHFDSSVGDQAPPWLKYGAALVGFVVLFLIFTRFPATWSARRQQVARAAGWIIAVAMLALIRFPDGSGFSFRRVDSILQALAHAVVFGSVIWMLTRRSIPLRLLALGLVIAFRFFAWRGGVAATVWNSTPTTAFLQVGLVVYMCSVLPGTIVGDHIAAWMRASPSAKRGWSRGRVLMITGAMLATIPIAVVGVDARLIWPTLGVLAAVLAPAVWLARSAVHPTEQLARQLLLWGALWLLLGVALDPAYGGMSKMEANPAWLIGTTGLAVLTLAALTVLTDLFNGASKVSLLVDNGQNPMIAYVANGMFVLPILALTTLKDHIERLTPSPWAGFVRGLLLTVLIAYLVRFFTRRRLFWKT